MKNKLLLLLIISLLYFSINACSEKKTILAKTPPMGWNSWNWFGKLGINEDIVIEVIDAMVKNGLRDVGYNYIVIDGGWRDTKLGLNGELMVHPGKFPNGIKRLADYAHLNGMKFGLHTVPGTADCIGDPVGGYGNEEVQISQFVDWGVDFIKLDLCRFKDGWSEDVLKETYFKWRKLMDEKSPTGIVLSISAYEWRDWYPEIGQMARTTEDISAKVGGMSGINAVFDSIIPVESNSWGLLSVMQIVEENDKWALKAGAGYWNDPDMLVTGEHGLTKNEQKSHFALWCIMSSPLFLGNDPRNMTKDELEIILNNEAIQVNQDPTEQGYRLKKNGDAEIWIKKLENGDRAVVLLNRSSCQKADITLNFIDISQRNSISVRDIYLHQDLGIFKNSMTRTVDPHACCFFILSNIED